MRYFAYGSNMATAYVRKFTPSATFVMRADLPNFHIEFRRYSQNLQGGISSIIEAPGEIVKGIIYEVDVQEIVNLDILESVPEGIYRRDAFLVFGEDGQWHRADLHRVTTPAGPYTPAKQYVDWMVAGAVEHHIDAEYTARLVALRKSLD